MLSAETRTKDPITRALHTYAQNILLVVFGLLPLIFVPTAVAPFEYTKVFFVIIGLSAALILYSLSVLRSGVVRVGVSYPLCALWVVAAVATVSGLLSGDVHDALIGDFFSAQSAMFVALLACVATVWLMVRPEKKTILRLYATFAITTVVLIVYYILRLVFGAEFLSFGLFTSTTSSLVGTWNDLALFLGLGIILSLVLLEHIRLTKVGKIIFLVTTFLSLAMLAIINFFAVWLVLGTASLVFVVYIFGRDRFSSAQPALLKGSTLNTLAATVSIIVFLVSLLFILGGSFFSTYISEFTQVNYVEVRPSLEATSNIAREVYTEHALLGIGPNKFIDAWRLYKADVINTSMFWNTDFDAGNGYITTFFVTTGVLGGLAWLVFLVTYIITGMRRLLTAPDTDKAWYLIAVSAFVASVYVWGMSFVYVPGVAILLIGALCTGIALQGMAMLHGTAGTPVTLGGDRRSGFLLTFAVVIIIVGTVSLLYAGTRHYASIYTFNQSLLAMQEGKPIAELEQTVRGAYILSTSDVYARRIAEYQLARLNTLMELSEPTEEQVREFSDASINGIQFAQDAVRIDALEPANHAVLARIYSVLVAANVDGAADKARESLAKSRELNPKNPLPQLESAILEARAGNYTLARTYIDNALVIKPNFTEAYYLLSELAVVQGNVDEALQSTRAVIALEPKNPVRHYQLGVLESYRKNTDAAIAAFTEAIALNPDYANARYLRALAYDLVGDSARAKVELEMVLALNPENTDVVELIAIIEADGSLARVRDRLEGTVQESSPTVGDAGNVQSSNTAETSLVTPINANSGSSN